MKNMPRVDLLTPTIVVKYCKAKPCFCHILFLFFLYLVNVHLVPIFPILLILLFF